MNKNKTSIQSRFCFLADIINLRYISPQWTCFAKLPIHHIVKSGFKRMNSKKCPLCSSSNVIRKGFHKDIQRWYCKECNKKFLSNRKVPPKKEELFCLFTFHKQTLKELRKVYHLRTSQTQKMLDVLHSPSKVYLIVDATYFGSKENTFCVIVFRDALKMFLRVFPFRCA